MSVYLKAAEYSAGQWRASCLAVKEVGGSDADSKKYGEMFCPIGDANLRAWGWDWHQGNEHESVVQKCRVLALLFAHAMHETGDL